MSWILWPFESNATVFSKPRDRLWKKPSSGGDCPAAWKKAHRAPEKQPGRKSFAEGPARQVPHSNLTNRYRVTPCLPSLTKEYHPMTARRKSPNTRVRSPTWSTYPTQTDANRLCTSIHASELRAFVVYKVDWLPKCMIRLPDHWNQQHYLPQIL